MTMRTNNRIELKKIELITKNRSMKEMVKDLNLKRMLTKDRASIGKKRKNDYGKRFPPR